MSKEDLAEGTAKLLIGGGHRGETMNLTGPVALTIEAVAALRKRPFRIVSVEEYVARSKDEDRARRWASTYFRLARGEWAKLDPSLGKLLGRPLRTMQAVLAIPRSA